MFSDGDVGNDDSDPDFQSARKRFRTPSGVGVSHFKFYVDQLSALLF